MLSYAGGEIWAIDPATKTGFAAGEPGGRPVLTVKNFRESKDETVHDIFERAVFFLADRLRVKQPGLIVIEAPVPPRQIEGFTNFGATQIALGLQGIFIGIARCKSVPVLSAPIGAWRKHFLGRGNLKGDEAKRQSVRLCEQLGWNPPDANSAEAGGIWCWGCTQVAPARATRVEPLFARP